MIVNFDLYKAPREKLIATIDEYNALKTHHQEQANECDNAIHKLKDILASRQRLQDHRDKLNRMADAYINKYGRTLSDGLISDIMHEFECNKSYAASLADIIRKKVKKHERDQRNARIIILSEHMTYEDVGKEFGITKHAVGKIVKQAANSNIF